ncbi:hypothetical protein A8U91_04505 [Halomonas elongata]|uniref:Uncharacterized protein n=1 Tax=Halomonas elongata TaxID=2746 RepID=A0A1B8NZL1_HALEL|nr:hypothetical protein A8U91_04505 [Halomonas elongata]
MRRLTTTQKLWASLGLIWLAMLLMVGWEPGRIARPCSKSAVPASKSISTWQWP